MYRAAMRVPQRSSSSGSVDVVAVPVTVTKLNGGRSSSQQSATRPSRRIDFPLMVSADVMNTMSSPSRSTHTGARWGEPSRRVTATLAVRAGRAVTNACHQPAGASVYGRELDREEVAGAGVAAGVAELRHRPGFD